MKASFTPPYQIAPVTVESGTMNSPQVPAVYLTVEGRTAVITPDMAIEIGQALIASAMEATK